MWKHYHVREQKCKTSGVSADCIGLFGTGIGYECGAGKLSYFTRYPEVYENSLIFFCEVVPAYVFFLAYPNFGPDPVNAMFQISNF